MELASLESIRALIAATGKPARVRQRRCAPAPVRPATKARARVCRCGQCRQCLENARWESIFAEKFADPDYYSRPLLRVSSPLTSL
jgi:hypothetical protein